MRSTEPEQSCSTGRNFLILEEMLRFGRSFFKRTYSVLFLCAHSEYDISCIIPIGRCGESSKSSTAMRTLSRTCFGCKDQLKRHSPRSVSVHVFPLSDTFFLLSCSTVQVNYLASEMMAGEQLSQQQVWPLW